MYAERRRKTSLTIFTSHFIARVRKGCVGFYCERELEIEHNCNILTAHSYGRHVESFLFSWCSTGGLGAHSAGWSATSYQQLLWSPNSIGVPEGPLGRVWLSLPHSSPTGCNSTGSSNSTELYNRSTPTRSSKSNVWSSSSGNNCHAVQRSLSSGASVYECTMGIF